MISSHCLSMIFSENRYPLFRIMLYEAPFVGQIRVLGFRQSPENTLRDPIRPLGPQRMAEVAALAASATGAPRKAQPHAKL